MNDNPKIKEKDSVLIARFIELRNQRKAADERYAEFRKEEYDAPMQELERTLIQLLQERGIKNISSTEGTAALRHSSSVTMADGAAFRSYVLDNELWELADWRPNKTKVDELVKAGDDLPPGVNRSVFVTIQVLSKR